MLTTPATPPYSAHPGGFFISHSYMPPKTFSKEPLSVEQQIHLLEARGLVVSNKKDAYQFLNFVSYYRFCGYALAFSECPQNSKNQHSYKPGTTFEQVLDCYNFDRKLRLLVINAIERIEVAIRTVMTNELALYYGSHWYTNTELFLPAFNHEAFIQNVQKETAYQAQIGSDKYIKRESFIQHYYENYHTPKLPAIWMLGERFSLGTLSRLFANLTNRSHQKLICRPFGLSEQIMRSWLHSLTYLRNLCAHHCRLWNRQFTIIPKIANDYKNQLSLNSNFAAYAVTLEIFIKIISPKSNWSQRLWELIKAHPDFYQVNMGFSKNCEKDPFWRIQ